MALGTTMGVPYVVSKEKPAELSSTCAFVFLYVGVVEILSKILFQER